MSVRVAPVTPTGFPSPVSEALPGAIERLVQGLQPEKIVLFGSYGYGDPTPDSDVDLLVVMETDAPHVERYVAASLLLVPRPFPVDIIVRTPAEIQAALAGGDFFIGEILSRGQVLYERDQRSPGVGSPR